MLADEINRRRPRPRPHCSRRCRNGVRCLGGSHPLPSPFFVLATQNPIELEGTYPLPEAQIDRFTFKVLVDGVDSETLAEIITTGGTVRRPNWTWCVLPRNCRSCSRWWTG
ncbi:MAG: hypothetical protein Ct9H300mP1_13920 [Planctomycetaceae bacterium]|nr:MAG: hypothetical protein Ct9H300mP1_13920 [Planctomycetaceae bacterium]